MISLAKNIARWVMQAAVAAFLPLLAHAQNPTGASCTPVIQRVIHINGLNTTESGAEKNLDELAKALTSAPEVAELSRSGSLVFQYIQNPSAEIAINLYESLSQKLALGTSDIATLLGEIAYDGFAELRAKALGTPANVPTELQLQEVRASALATYRAATTVPLDRAVLTEFTMRYAPEIIAHIRAGEHVLLVPHSQGNLFAVDLYNQVVAALGAEERQRLTVLPVAPPFTIATGDTPAPNTPYILLKSDLVISSLGIPATTEHSLTEQLRNLPPSAPFSAQERVAAANKHLFNDWFGHRFIAVYLDDQHRMSGNAGTLRSQLVRHATTLMTGIAAARQNRCPGMAATSTP